MIDYQDLIKTHPNLMSNDNKALLEIITNPKTIANWVKNKKEQLKKEGKPQGWGDIGVIYSDPFIIILRDLVRFPNGTLNGYFRIIKTASIKNGKGTVILTTYQEKLLLLRQFRHATRQWHWETPRGFGESSLEPEENAKKEIKEEINGITNSLIKLGPYHTDTGVEGDEVELFFADLQSVGETNINEGISQYQLFDIPTVESMIANAEITDGFTIAAYTRAKLRGLI